MQKWGPVWLSRRAERGQEPQRTRPGPLKAGGEHGRLFLIFYDKTYNIYDLPFSHLCTCSSVASTALTPCPTLSTTRLRNSPSPS